MLRPSSASSVAILRDRPRNVLGDQHDRVVVAGDFDGVAVDLRHHHATRAERRADHDRFAVAEFERDANGVRVRLVVERRLLERVGQSLALGDLERGANAVVVGAKAHETGDDRLVGAVAFTGARERAVQLDRGAIRRSADESAREESEPARARRVRATTARP